MFLFVRVPVGSFWVEATPLSCSVVALMGSSFSLVDFH